MKIKVKLNLFMLGIMTAAVAGISVMLIQQFSEISPEIASSNLTRLHVMAIYYIVVSGAITYVVLDRATKPIFKITNILKDISEGEGDLTRRIEINSKDETADLAKYFNLTLEKIKNMVVKIKKETEALSDTGGELIDKMNESKKATNKITENTLDIKENIITQDASVIKTNTTMRQITANIDKLNEYVENQSSSVTKSSLAIDELLASIDSVTQTLLKNIQNVSDLKSASEAGRTGLQEVSTDIQEIARESEGLFEINAVIENIASQTNLLSINAAIEAAHAGEAGKGFAVVADEIRKLAESSSGQSKTINQVLKKIKGSIDKIKKSTENVLQKFEAIDSSVNTVVEQEENIRNAMEEQGHGSKQLLESIKYVNDVTLQVKNCSVEMHNDSTEVINESLDLEKITHGITNKISTMASTTGQINEMINYVNGLCGKNDENIKQLVQEVSRFKVE